LSVGSAARLFNYQLLDSNLIYILPITLFVFPSLLGESFFRGILIPQDTRQKGLRRILLVSLTSSILFVLWHPLNALTINKSAQDIFFNYYFLLIVFFLGMACSLSYILSRSLWVPIIIHWITIVVWVYLLGGRNLILGNN